jgi:hypothetical protein
MSIVVCAPVDWCIYGYFLINLISVGLCSQLCFPVASLWSYCVSSCDLPLWDFYLLAPIFCWGTSCNNLPGKGT